jgi:cobalt/nickel transport system permease protein
MSLFEEILEDIAQTNGLREVNTHVKIVTGLGALILCLLSQSYIAPLFIAALLSGAILFLARIDARTYGELFIVPFSFAVMSIAVIILLTGGGNEIYWSWSPFSWLSLSITQESLNRGIYIICRVIGGTSALIFIALTIPMTDLFVVMKQCRIPAAVIDFAMIIYRTIFLILNHVMQTYQAQIMRVGYGLSVRNTIQSFATMCGSGFVASWESGEDLIRAMDARCYDGKFATLGKTDSVHISSVVVVGLFFLISSAVIVITQNSTLL